MQLARLGDPAFTAAKLKPLSGSRTADEAGRWVEYRKLGDELRGFYQQMPERIRGGDGARTPTRPGGRGDCSRWSIPAT